MITYPTNEIRSLDELQKWITDKTTYDQITVKDEKTGEVRIVDRSIPIDQLRAFVKEDILRDYLLHHKTLTVNGSVCTIDILASLIPEVYKVSFNYVTTDND